MKRKNAGGKLRTLLCALLAGAVTLGGGNAVMAENGGACYQVFVYSFCDGNADGIGDLPGLTEKLSYLGPEGLGFDALWVCPIFPSPSYHKYDVTDYYGIDPQYGTMEDFEVLLESCHEKGISLYLDLAVNHTSSEHPWFLEAAQYLRGLPEGAEPSPEECPFFSYYNFLPEAHDGYAPLSGTDWYYEARFSEGMPDLNLDSEKVREEITDIASFWLAKGVDGFRLDAVTSYYTESQEKSIAFLSWFTDMVKGIHPDAYLVGEAWTDVDSYARYYESGIDSLFDFAFSGPEGVIAAVARGKRPASWYGEKLVKEEELFASFREDYVRAPFYTNHDMGRGSGYYTRDDGSRAKLALALHLLMPGKVFLYYGEELGMKGSGRDENKRAPMYWGTEEGLCAGPPEMEEVTMKYGPLTEQEGDPDSIYSFVKALMDLRTSCPVIGTGKTVYLEEYSGKEACVLLREPREAAGEGAQEEDGESVLLVYNTSEEEFTLDLSGCLPEEQGISLAGGAFARGGEALLSGQELTLPPMGAAVLTVLKTS